MIETPRVLLRGWRDEDAAAHHALCGDPRVLAMLGDKPTMEDSRDVARRQRALEAEHGYCFWALEHGGAFAGWCGLKPGKWPIEGEIEIGWTLAPDLWGRGLACEAATAVLDWTWTTTEMPAVAAITATVNRRSRALMERLGLVYRPDGDFDHLEIPPGDPLRRHVLYRIARPA